ncbi:MAG: beta-ketoacyl-[acyl-carrier-protein] synthase family protein [Dermatophilaceae bacterium]
MDGTGVRVVGVGAVSPVGADAHSTWEALLAGATGVRTVELDEGLVTVAPAAEGFTERVPATRARRLDRAQQLALVAAREAWTDAGRPQVAPDLLAVVVGSGIGGVQTLLQQSDVYRNKGARAVSAHGFTMTMPDGPAVAVGLDLGAKAGVHAPVSACASGAEAVAWALLLLRTGAADVVVCGGSEAGLLPLSLAGFGAMRALSRIGDADRTPRPFDAARDGFVLGEGAAMLVLESQRREQTRPAYARLLGAGMSSDAFHPVAPDPTGEGGVRAMRAALGSAGCGPADVTHLNTHATATPLGDIAEARAIHAVLGADAASVPVTATKSATGHLLGAAGALEAVITVLSVSEGCAPPTRNLDTLDPEIELQVVTHAPAKIARGVALSNSFGFGGHNVTLAVGPTPDTAVSRPLPAPATAERGG